MVSPSHTSGDNSIDEPTTYCTTVISSGAVAGAAPLPTVYFECFEECSVDMSLDSGCCSGDSSTDTGLCLV